MNIKSNNFAVASITILLLALTNAASSIGHDSEIGLMNFMARSNALLQQNPARSLECFNFYIPLINQIVKDYETNFKACQNESVAARSRADEATLDQRKNLANAAQNACDLLSQCSDIVWVAGVFQCYIDGGASNIKTMYGINANASQELADLREQYYLIEAEEYKCTNETKRAYEQKSAAAYASLNSCILGNSEVPTNPPATAEPEQPTAAPEQPTAAPEQPTAAPEQPTAAPEQPTAAPEQPTPAPEQPTAAPEQPTAAPEQPTAAPEQPTAAPEQPTAAPEQPIAAPVQPSPAEPEATTKEAETTDDGVVISSEQPNTVAPDNSEIYDY